MLSSVIGSLLPPVAWVFASTLVPLASRADLPSPSEQATVPSLAALRHNAIPQPADSATFVVLGYFSSGDGGGGVFRYDAGDAVSVDNGGTIIVDGHGRRWKRMSVGAVDVRWFGAGGAALRDSGPAIQNAINWCEQTSHVLFFSAGNYVILHPLTIGADGVAVRGEGASSTILTAGARMECLLRFSSKRRGPLTRDTVETIAFNGQHNADYGILGPRVAHFIMERCRCSGCLAAGFGFGYGWSNRIYASEFSYNYGDGIRSLAGELNGLVISGCEIFNNRGIGIDLRQSGKAITVNGCVIEGNDLTGIYALQAGGALAIRSCYFEANSMAGYEFKLPAAKIRADVILNGSPSDPTIMSTVSGLSASITGCFHSMAYSQCAYFVITTDSLRVIGNEVAPKSANQALLGIWCDSRYSHPRNVVIESNVGWSSNLVALGGANTLAFLGTWTDGTVARHNYAPDDPFQFGSNLAGGGASLSKSDLHHGGADCWELDGAGNIGFEIDTEQHPEIANRWLYFHVDYRLIAPADGNLDLIVIDGDRKRVDSADYFIKDSDWHQAEVAFQMPAAGKARLVLHRIGSAAAIAVSRVAVAPVGADFESLEYPVDYASGAMPRSGQWQQGDFVRNTVPRPLGAPDARYLLLGWTRITSGGGAVPGRDWVELHVPIAD